MGILTDQKQTMTPSQKTAATTLRRASSLSKVSTPPATAAASPPASSRPSKASKPSKIVRLPLSKDLLSRWPHEKNVRKQNQAKASPLSQSTTVAPDEPTISTPVKSEPDPKPKPKSKPTIKEEGAQVSPAKDVKEEIQADPKTGTKREAGAALEGDDRDKLKANPRKRSKPDPNRPDGRTAAAKAAKGAAGVTTASHKLGPKANQGAINAGLRALDRTGKQCRKWEKTGFRIKTFTGRAWQISSWKAPTTRAFGSESETATPNSQSKENSSSNIGSDKSPAVLPSNVASSPATGIVMPA